MTQKHTPEPWKLYRNDQSVGDAVGNAVCDAWPRGDDQLASAEGKANARRIVACVNACEGMEDPAAFIAGLRSELQLATHKLLTCGVAARHPDTSLSRRESDYGGKWNSPQAESVRQLRQQRDELLAELVITLGSLKEICSVRQIPRPESTIRRAESVINKTTGETK